jgi:hypothetical protein
MSPQKDSHTEPISASRYERRLPSWLFGLAAGACILVAALLAIAVTASPARAVTTGDITGTVTNASAGSLANITVNAYVSDGSGGWNQQASTKTGAGGSYDLAGLPTGSYMLEFRDDNGGSYATQFYNHASWFDTATPVAVTAGETTPNINVTLGVAGHITGTVKNASGAGLATITVNVSAVGLPGSYQFNTTTGADGTYNVGGMPTGSYVVTFDLGMGDSQDAVGKDYFAQSYDHASLDAPTPVAVTAGQTTPNINATLVAAGHITGTVKNADGVGLATITVNVSASDSPGSYEYNTTTGADGTYNVRGMPTGSYSVSFNLGMGDSDGSIGSSYLPQPYDHLVAVTAGQTTPNINVTLAPAGHIIDRCRRQLQLRPPAHGQLLGVVQRVLGGRQQQRRRLHRAVL